MASASVPMATCSANRNVSLKAIFVVCVLALGLVPSAFAYIEDIITESANGPTSVYAEDMNGDGAADILVSSDNGEVRLFLSDGDTPSPDFSEKLIPTSADEAFCVHARDINGDGAADFLVAFKGDSKVILYLNDGDASSPEFTEQVISDNADGAHSVYATDMNGDGAADILVASMDDDKVRLFINDGSVSNVGFTEQLITDSATGAYCVYAKDMNGDGAVDILVASKDDNKVRLFLNDGNAPSPGFTEHIIFAHAKGAHSVYAKDINGDGAPDVLVATYIDSKVRLLLNDGDASSPSFTWNEVITENSAGAKSVYAEDMNGDGAADILVTSYHGGKVWLFLNDGDASSPGFTEQLITDEVPASLSVYAKDMNGDGDEDILVTALGDDSVRLFLNPYPTVTPTVAPTEPTPAPTSAPVIPCNTDDDCEDDQHCECSHGALRRGLLFGNAIDEDCTCTEMSP